MIKTNVYSITGSLKGEVSLPEAIFDAKVNPPLVAQAVRVYLANQRSGGAATKTRAEINRTKAKWFRQKGTGHARHGSRSAPIFVGGGIAHGPKPKDWRLGLPAKMGKAALASALTQKFQNKELVVMEEPTKLPPKTKEAARFLTSLGVGGERLTWVWSNGDDNLVKAARNLEGVTLRNARLLSTYDVVNCDKLLLVEDSVAVLAHRYGMETKKGRLAGKKKVEGDIK